MLPWRRVVCIAAESGRFIANYCLFADKNTIAHAIINLVDITCLFYFRKLYQLYGLAGVPVGGGGGGGIISVSDLYEI